MMPAPGCQKPQPYFAAAARRKSYTSWFSASERAQIGASPRSRAWIRWSQCIVVGTATRSRPVCMNCSSPVWPEHVLEHHAVGPQRELALAGGERLPFGIVEVPEQQLVRERERPRVAAAHDVEVSRHGLVDPRGHLRSGVDGVHAPEHGSARREKNANRSSTT